jgi:hypothetical protein
METTLAAIDFRQEANTLQQELDEFSLPQRQHADSNPSAQSSVRVIATLQRLAPLVETLDLFHTLPPRQRRGYAQLFCLVQTMRMNLRQCNAAII